jgi:hypothetical protein
LRLIFCTQDPTSFEKTDILLVALPLWWNFFQEPKSGFPFNWTAELCSDFATFAQAGYRQDVSYTGGTFLAIKLPRKQINLE